MKHFISLVTIILILIQPTKAYSGLRLKAASLLVKPAITEVKNYKHIRQTAKENKKAVYNLTVGDIYYLERIGFPNIQKMVDTALQTSIEIEGKSFLKNIINEDKEKSVDAIRCVTDVEYNEIKENIKNGVERHKIEKADRYITIFLIESLKKCSDHSFSNDELIYIKRSIEFTIEEALRS